MPNATYTQIKKEIAKAYIGDNKTISALVTALFAGGHVLLEGVPGLAKTTLAKALASTIDASFRRVQFTMDLMPLDITGSNIYKMNDGEFRFIPGPIFTNILLADEINRATPKTQSALLEAMQEKSVTVGTTTYKLDAPFFVMATQNPLDMEGTYPLPEAQLDRFLFKINVPFPKKDELHEILNRTTSGKSPKVGVVMTKEEILQLRELAAEVPIAPHVQDYALKIMLATHPELDESTKMVKQYVRVGSGPRGAQSIIKAAKIHAIFDGRFNVSNDDIRFAAIPSLRHRTILSFEGEAENIQTDDIIKDIIKNTKETAKD